jgi:hypothetical protein
MNIHNNGLIESILRLMKAHPSYLLDYLESCAQEELANFMNELPSFYFDYSEISSYSEFLQIFFTRKRDKGGFIDYNKQQVSNNNIQDFKSLFNSLIWEADCISFAQGIIESIVNDIKKLRKLDDGETTDDNSRGKFVPGLSDNSLNSSQVITPTRSSTIQQRTSMTSPGKGPSAPIKKPLSIQALKITTGNENGEIMKNYRETAEKFIKDHIIHQPYASTIFTADQLTGHIKSLFQQVIGR